MLSPQHPSSHFVSMDPVHIGVITSLVREGIFGDVECVGLQENENTDLGAQFASTLDFVKLTLKGTSGHTFTLPLVLKLPLRDPSTRAARGSDSMFHNEVVMYTGVLPALGVSPGLYPKMYHGTIGADEDLLILEDVRYNGFELSRQKVFLDFDHISLVIRRIAEFHSLSYILKHREPNRFFQLVGQLREVVTPDSIRERLSIIQFATMERGIKPLLRTKDSNILVHCLQLLKNPIHIKNLLSAPEEPYAVICHGDFCNNNVMYKYNESAQPIDCSFFDFQLSRYSSPSIDLFFFLYMHTTSAFREMYWDQILESYWKTLKKNLPKDVEIPCLEDFMKHLGERAVYGYTICSWFLPAMIDRNPITDDDYAVLSIDEKVKRFVNVAGEEGEKIICDIVLHLLNRYYLNQFVQFYKEKNV